MKTLDPYTIPLESINLIEASAGTGKSWTVTYLYLRLILEKKLTVDQILVVTFTDAATKELRDDIRHRIVSALHAFELANSEAGYHEDDEYAKLIANQRCTEQNGNNTFDEAIHQLKRAKLSMDEAAVFTIHSFCQRSLSDNAFEAGLPFDSELIEDDSTLKQKITDDFWRRRFYKAPKSLLFKLQQKRITPDSLLADISSHVGKPYLTLCGPLAKDVQAEKWSSLETLFSRVIDLWKREEDEIKGLLLDPDLTKHYYKGLLDNISTAIDEISKAVTFDIVPAHIDVKVMKWLGEEPKLKKTAKREPIEHEFFSLWQQFLDLWQEINTQTDDFLNTIRIELLHHLQDELPKAKHRLGILSFDDLLLQMQAAIHKHPLLSQTLLNKYPAALIDEFQDTDPIQYDIFSTIYQHDSAAPVFLVGDPKQAIYSFRGGDIHTYLQAKADTQSANQFTLTKNWRSLPTLIDAFNTLYAQCDNPFKDEGIDYVTVSSGDKNNQKVIAPNNSSSPSALNFWQYHTDVEKPNADLVRQEIANAVAGDIAQLLNDGMKGIAKIGDKPISGGDIAILIRSHKHAETIKVALNARGVSCVQSSKESIYETREANSLSFLLQAIATQNEDEIRRALTTDLIGYKSDDLIALLEETNLTQNSWETLLTQVQQWHQLWNKQGLLAMMRKLMQDLNMHQQLLSFVDGERRVSNVLQVAELLHQASRQQMLGMHETLRWFEKQQQSSNSKETELRLESDEDLVKIVTIHKSKGLEYPIVYCPYIGMSRAGLKDSIFTFYKDGTACLEVGSTDKEAHKVLKKEEENAEDARLLYVALTRAKYQCNVMCFTDAIDYSPDNSSLGWILTNGLSVSGGKAQKTAYYDAYKSTLARFKFRDSSISVMPMPEYEQDLMYQQSTSQKALKAREFTAEIRSQAQMTSFSGLTSGAHDESPDYDFNIQQKSVSPILVSEDEFPKGATAGTALHEMFEHIDFQTPVIDQLQIIESVLDKYSFEQKYQESAIQLIQQTLDADLSKDNDRTFSLSNIEQSKRLDEMEFYLPLDHLNINDLKQILFQYLPKENNHWQLIRDAVNDLYFDDVEGYLKGYIDLLFEYDGLYYLADYKSNTLGDYEQESLFDAMAHSHYYLQYLLYSVALHRYLKQRLKDYSWETHIGGAYYLFIRGMEKDKKVGGASTPLSRTAQNGVFFDKPSYELIQALDGLFIDLQALH